MATIGLKNYVLFLLLNYWQFYLSYCKRALTPEENLMEDMALETVELLQKYGYKANIHEVTTEDGYILELHHLAPSGVQRRNLPVLIVHGLGSSSFDFISQGPGRSLAHLLSEAGYEVWLANARGNLYSLRHVNLTNSMPEFWKLSWHEIGYYDLPAIVNYILNKRGVKRLHYIGHSQGGTVLLVMLSTRPEYNKKLASVHLLAPAVFMGQASLELKILSLFEKRILKLYFDWTGKFNMPSGHSLLKTRAAYYTCRKQSARRSYCESLLYLVNGPPNELMNFTAFPLSLSHFPASFSVYQLEHYCQLIISKRFRQFDYGRAENRRHYGSDTPPDYPLDKVTAPVALYYADKDVLTAVEDLRDLRPKLRSLMLFHRIPHPDFNHCDFLFAINASHYVYNKVFEVIRQYDTSEETTTVTKSIKVNDYTTIISSFMDYEITTSLDITMDNNESTTSLSFSNDNYQITTDSGSAGDLETTTSSSTKITSDDNYDTTMSLINDTVEFNSQTT